MEGELGLLLTPALPTDEATLALMKTPRCSLPDLPTAPARRRRQAPAPTKWNKRNLSWRWVGGVPPAFPRKSQGPLKFWGSEVRDPSVGHRAGSSQALGERPSLPSLPGPLLSCVSSSFS